MPPVIVSGEMPTDDLILERQKATVGANNAFNSTLVADTLNPFVGAGWLITAFTGFATFKTERVSILPAAKQTAEQFNFTLR